MKRLLLFGALLCALWTPLARAQTPTIINFWCQGSTYNIDVSSQCYVSMTGYLVYAAEYVYATCSNGWSIEQDGDAFAACSENQPTASALGDVNYGIPFIDFPGRINIQVTLAPFNGGVLTGFGTMDCYGVPTKRIDPIGLC